MNMLGMIASFLLSFTSAVSGNIKIANVIDGTDSICVQFGIEESSCAIYKAESIHGDMIYSDTSKVGNYVSNPNGWVVQSDYSDSGKLMDEEALVTYLNNNKDTLRGTTTTLLKIEDDGYIYDDGIDYMSVLGDSISTLSGVTDVAGYNNKTADNAARYYDPETGINYSGATLPLSREQTWWEQVADQTGLTLLVNSSVRGELVRDGTKRRGELCADKDIQGEMHVNTAPDVIFVYLGTNDYRTSSMTASVFYKNYYKMLKKLSGKYMHANIYCIDITDCYVPYLTDELFIDQEVGVTLESWDGISYRLQHFDAQIDRAIRKVNKKNGDARIHLIKLSNQNYTMMQTLNFLEDEDMTDALSINSGVGRTWLSLHPGPEGHTNIADAVLAVLDGSQVPREETILSNRFDSGASGVDAETPASSNVWKIRTTDAEYLEDDTELYLDRYEAVEDITIEKIQVPVICVSDGTLWEVLTAL